MLKLNTRLYPNATAKFCNNSNQIVTSQLYRHGLKQYTKQIRSFCSKPKKSAREIAKEISAKKKIGKEKAADALKAEEISGAGASGTGSFFVKVFVTGSVIGGIVWMSFTDSGNKFAKENILSKDSKVGFILDNAMQLIMSPFQEQFKPSRDKLLPDMPPIPAGHVAHRTLILDLEGTLCHSTWDRKNGWRAAKRPGLDEFLAKMCQFYEIVLYSTGTFMTDQPLTGQLDKFHTIQHFLYRDATLFKDGQYIKDLSNINRDLSRVIVIDDVPEEVAFHKDNVLQIKNYEASNVDDCELSKLSNFLEDLFYRDVRDIRQELKKYGDDDVLDKFTIDKSIRDQQQNEQRKKGLGGFIRRRNQK